MSTELEAVLGEDVNLNATPEPQPEAAPTPEQPAPTPEPPPEPPKTVPLAALHEERQRRKEEQQARQALEQRLAALEAANKPQAPQPPKFEEDPANHLKHTAETLEARTRAAEERLAQFDRQQQLEQVVRQAETVVMQHEAQFKATKPDYGDALNYFMASRAKEFEASGHDPQTAAQMAVQEAKQGAIINAAHGRNPAEIAYRLAEARGYRPKPAEPSPAEKLANQQKGVAAAKSLGGGGSSAPSTPSVEALLQMSDEDFAEATKGGKWAKLMG